MAHDAQRQSFPGARDHCEDILWNTVKLKSVIIPFHCQHFLEVAYCVCSAQNRII